MLKKLTFAYVLAICCASMAFGQIRTPAPSPAASFTQAVGLITVSGEYSRPGVKGRTIFGDLVPYDKVWRTGANAVSKLSFSGDLMVGGQDLKAGDYAILTKPGRTSWDIHFYSYESGNWGSYVSKDPALVVSATPQTLPFSVENFFITVADLKDDGGTLEIIWDNVLVPIELKVDTDSAVMANIDRVLNGPSAGDYYAAGQYLHGQGKDLEKALMYVQKATSGDSPRFWQVRREALILADLGRKAEAIAVAKKSLELAKTAGNDDYIRMNEKSIKEWSM